jgi:hypothetical protein
VKKLCSILARELVAFISSAIRRLRRGAISQHCRMLLILTSFILGQNAFAQNNNENEWDDENNFENVANNDVEQNGAPTQEGTPSNKAENKMDSEDNFDNSEDSNFLGQGGVDEAGEDDDFDHEDPSVSDAKEIREFYYDRRRNPHPRSATSFATRRLNISVKKPSEGKLNVCVQEFRVTSKQARNSTALIEAVKLMAVPISKNVGFYHWCFYHFASAIDWKLEEDSRNLRIQEKVSMFVENMKGLWLLAQSLDKSVKSKIYHEYLQVRYLELSKAHFGRVLEVISAPLGDPRWVAPSQVFSPAGAFIE